MNPSFQNRGGFTLIEVVATLVLTSIVLVFAGMLVVTSTRIFLDSKHAAEDSQKMQVAMNRLVKELTYAGVGTVSIPNSRTVSWTSHHPERFGEPGSVTWNGTAGSNLQFFTSSLQGSVLLDNVSEFSISSTPSTSDTITVTLRSTRSPGVAHTMVVHPRYDR